MPNWYGGGRKVFHKNLTKLRDHTAKYIDGPSRRLRQQRIVTDPKFRQYYAKTVGVSVDVLPTKINSNSNRDDVLLPKSADGFVDSQLYLEQSRSRTPLYRLYDNKRKPLLQRGGTSSSNSRYKDSQGVLMGRNHRVTAPNTNGVPPKNVVPARRPGPGL
eukprot:PhF_6_TR5525/c0_g1_i2/m.7848